MNVPLGFKAVGKGRSFWEDFPLPFPSPPATSPLRGKSDEDYLVFRKGVEWTFLSPSPFDLLGARLFSLLCSGELPTPLASSSSLLSFSAEVLRGLPWFDFLPPVPFVKSRFSKELLDLKFQPSGS